MMTIADLITALERLPKHLPVGTITSDRAGDIFQGGVMPKRVFLKEMSDRVIDGDAPGGAEEVVALI